MSNSRRHFIKSIALGSGTFFIGIAAPASLVGKAGEEDAVSFQPNLLMRLDSDGIVHFNYTRHEMGQGSFTGLSMIFADELGADWAKFEAEQVDFDLKYGDRIYGNTGGSNTIRSMWEPLRELAAAARIMLEKAAAEEWQVAAQDCFAENSTVVHRPSGRSLSFGALAPAAARQAIPDNLVYRKIEDRRIVGRGVPNLNIDKIVNGALPYSMDVKVPGMLYAAIERCPLHLGKIRSYDAEAARRVSGVVDVIAIRQSDFPVINGFSSMREGVAVLANNTWAAFEAKKLLKIQWDGDTGQGNTMEEIDQEVEQASARKADFTAFDTGEAVKRLEDATRTFTRTYNNPYQVHALMEPPSATAYYKEGKCEVWTSAQHPKRVLERAARATDLPIEQFTFHNLSCGGSFGRRYYDDFLTEAVCLSKQADKPVKVVWSREDEIRTSGYHAHQAEEQTVALDEHNNILAWRERSYMVAGAEEIQWIYPLHPYYNQHRLQEAIQIKPRLPIMAWRSVQAHQHALGSECFIDELAIELGKDPIRYRLELMRNHADPERFSTEHSDGIFQFCKELIIPRAERVFQSLLESEAWTTPLPEGFGRGVAGHSFGPTFVGQIAEVSVIKGKLRVHKITCVADCGTVINPQLARGQIEGGIIWGLSALFYNRVTLQNARVEQSNFHDYPLLRIHETPEIDITFLESTEAPTGLGEPGVPPLAPAVLNAIFNATGKRLREIPIDRSEFSYG